MRHANPPVIESRTRPQRLARNRIVALAPLLMLVWLAYWVGMVSQACCLPLLSDTHHSSHADDHDSHHDGVLAVLEPVAPMDNEHCPEPGIAELVPASTGALVESAPKPVLIALISLSVPLSGFGTPSSHTFYQQSHPPPSRYLRNRRLLI